jgi:4-hydroxythreonine-4-phosphate dehydrogenase
MSSRILAVTPGDPDGVGPEIVWKAIRARADRAAGVSLLCVGARKPFERLGARVIEADPAILDRNAGAPVPPRERRPHVWLLPAPARAPGEKHLAGFQSGWSVVQATRLVQSGRALALVTGPIHKDRLQRGGYPFIGHTELLAHLCKVRDVTMMLANDQLRVTLVTIHLALKDVPRAVTEREIRRTVLQTAAALRTGWKIRRPRIAVLGLNPHAGESGLLGTEDSRVIAPAIARLRGPFNLSGPHPSDTLFAKHIGGDAYDAVVCMYHDQGLIPVKLLDFAGTVNVTLGLPIIRTSVDHGVGFDIAGRGVADPSSLIAAIRLASRLTRTSRRKPK